jgi:hypothetical protein
MTPTCRVWAKQLSITHVEEWLIVRINSQRRQTQRALPVDRPTHLAANPNEMYIRVNCHRNDSPRGTAADLCCTCSELACNESRFFVRRTDRAVRNAVREKSDVYCG